MRIILIDAGDRNSYIAWLKMMTVPTRDTKAAVPVTPVRHIASHALFGAARELVIVHDHADYRLRITANNKLILTK